MKTKLASGLVLGLLLTANSYGTAHSSPVTPENERVITIGVYDYAHAKSSLLLEAERTAAAILRKAGVETKWLSCPTDEASPRNPACATTTDPTHLTLRILPGSMSSRWRQASDDALGMALLGQELSRDAWVLYDRVSGLAEQHEVTLAIVLGSVIAHEMGHLLLGEKSHSEAGLMRAHWSLKELLAAECGRLVFSHAEGERIRRAVIARRQAAAAITEAYLSDARTSPRN
jgi:hypothetical protein